MLQDSYIFTSSSCSWRRVNLFPLCSQLALKCVILSFMSFQWPVFLSCHSSSTHAVSSRVLFVSPGLVPEPKSQVEKAKEEHKRVSKWHRSGTVSQPTAVWIRQHDWSFHMSLPSSWLTYPLVHDIHYTSDGDGTRTTTESLVVSSVTAQSRAATDWFLLQLWQQNEFQSLRCSSLAVNDLKHSQYDSSTDEVFSIVVITL